MPPGSPLDLREVVALVDSVVQRAIGRSGDQRGIEPPPGRDSLVFGVTPTDPGTLAGVAALLAAVTLLACYLSSRTATRVDPLTALRSE